MEETSSADMAAAMAKSSGLCRRCASSSPLDANGRCEVCARLEQPREVWFGDTGCRLTTSSTDQTVARRNVRVLRASITIARRIAEQAVLDHDRKLMHRAAQLFKEIADGLHDVGVAMMPRARR